MKINHEFDSNRLSKSVEDLKHNKPDYSPLLDLYEKIFLAQEESRPSVSLEETEIPSELIQTKIKEGFPLIDISQFKIDYSEGQKLFRRLCDILIEGENEFSESAAAIARVFDANRIDYPSMCNFFLNEDEKSFNAVAGELDVDNASLAFILYNSIKPSLSVNAEKLSSRIDENEIWEKGYCPVCGSQASLSLFEENGKRYLVCGFCWHKYASKRVFCHYCENTDHETLHYYSFEDEEGYRVDVCDKCKKYIKTIDCRVFGRYLYPPLEYISTAHLDIKMEEMEFENAFDPQR